MLRFLYKGREILFICKTLYLSHYEEKQQYIDVA